MKKVDRTAQFRRRRDDAVSPVVSTILLMAMIMIAISGVLVWGLPMIRQMEANVEFNGALNTMRAVNEIITDTVQAGRADEARPYDYTEGSGRFTISNEIEVWSVAYRNDDTAAAQDLSRFILEDVDLTGLAVSYRWNGNTSINRVNITYIADDVNNTVTQEETNITATLWNGNITADSSATTALLTTTGIIHIQFINDSYAAEINSTVVDVWIISVGSLIYEQEIEGKDFIIYAANGGVTTNYPGGTTQFNYDVNPLGRTVLARSDDAGQTLSLILIRFDPDVSLPSGSGIDATLGIRLDDPLYKLLDLDGVSTPIVHVDYPGGAEGDFDTISQFDYRLADVANETDSYRGLGPIETGIPDWGTTLYPLDGFTDLNVIIANVSVYHER